MNTYTQKEFAASLKEFFQRKPMSLNEIADQMEFDRGYFNKLVNGNKNIQVTTLLRISENFPDLDWNRCFKPNTSYVTKNTDSHLSILKDDPIQVTELELLRENRALRLQVSELELKLKNCKPSPDSN